MQIQIINSFVKAHRRALVKAIIISQNENPTAWNYERVTYKTSPKIVKEIGDKIFTSTVKIITTYINTHKPTIRQALQAKNALTTDWEDTLKNNWQSLCWS